VASQVGSLDFVDAKTYLITSYTIERTLYGLIKDNAGIIQKQTQRLLELKQSFDSGVTLQTAIVTFRIQEDVSQLRKSFSSDLYAVLMFVDRGV
jgi:hypothetical protein